MVFVPAPLKRNIWTVKKKKGKQLPGFHQSGGTSLEAGSSEPLLLRGVADWLPYMIILKIYQK